ncbi:hypothetical protein K9M47_01970 [Candidatus Gracilibacteria bacterium]|nr:hypothetical protein [Candidatus Gracilibacteria bacterium]
MEKEIKEIFVDTFNQLSDYTGDNIKESNWGIDTYSLIEKSGYFLITDEDTVKGRVFIYAVASSFIVTNFTNRIYNDFFIEVSSDKTIDFNKLGLFYEDIECYLDGVTDEKKKEITESGILSLEDIWISLWDYVNGINDGLCGVYKEQEVSDPIQKIYDSLISIFDTIDDETGEVVTVSVSFSNQMNAYSFVSEGFRY